MFTKGFESPFFFEEGGIIDRERETLKTIKIDTCKKIRKIAMIVTEDEELAGLRLIDEKGIYIINTTWMTKGNLSSDWMTRTLPGGKDIIGLKINYGAKNLITSLGFMTWTPRVEREITRPLKSKESFLFRNSPSFSPTLLK